MAIPVPVSKTKIATVPWGIPITNEVNRLTDVTVGMDTGWTPYTPTIGGTGWALGNGTVVGWYKLLGTKTVAYRGKFTSGSTSTYGANQLTISQPVPSMTTSRQLGLLVLVGSGVFHAICIAGNPLLCYSITTAVGGIGSLVQNAPMAWVAGNTLEWSVTYEAA